MNLIRVVKSHVKGKGSLIILIVPATGPVERKEELDATIAPDFTKSDATIAPNLIISGASIATNPKNSSKKNQKSNPTDSFININQEKKKQPEEKPTESFLNCNSLKIDRLNSSKESNLNIPAINLLCPAGPAEDKGEFSALGSIFRNCVPRVVAPTVDETIPQVTTEKPSISEQNIQDTIKQTTGITPTVIENGKKILSEKGFSQEEVKVITERITGDIMRLKPNKTNGYFLTSCKNEQRNKSVNNLSHVTSLASPSIQAKNSSAGQNVVVKKKPAVVDKTTVQEQPSAQELFQRIQVLKPMELYHVIIDVDNDPNLQKSLKFFSSDIVRGEILASHYVSEFKKRYPEVAV